MENELIKTIKKLYSYQKISKSGEPQNFDEIQVKITKRVINIKSHNTWKQITTTRSAILDEPGRNFNGVYKCQDSATIQDFMPNEFVALIFELEFEVDINGVDKKTLHLGC